MRSFFMSTFVVASLVPHLWMTAQVAAVKFTVTVPANSDKQNTKVFLAGSFNGWSSHDSLYIMKQENENFYSLIVPLFDGKTYSYKYTLGDWNRVETKLNDSNIANRKLHSKDGLVVIDTVLKWKPATRPPTLSPQMQKLAAIKDSAAAQLKVILNDLLILLKEYNENMLSPKPSARMHKRHKKQTVEAFAKLYNTLESKIWDVGTSLTAEQKEKILAIIKSQGQSKDIINTIANAYAQVLK